MMFQIGGVKCPPGGEISIKGAGGNFWPRQIEYDDNCGGKQDSGFMWNSELLNWLADIIVLLNMGLNSLGEKFRQVFWRYIAIKFIFCIYTLITTCNVISTFWYTEGMRITQIGYRLTEDNNLLNMYIIWFFKYAKF